MKRKLKVFGGNLDGVHRVIMACTSLTAFCKATTVSRSFASDTGNAIEIGVAMNEPGVIFAKRDSHGYHYRRIGPPPFSWSTLRVIDQEEANQ